MEQPAPSYRSIGACSTSPLHHRAEPIRRSYQLATELGIPIITPRLGELVVTGTRNSYPQWWEELWRV